MVISKRYKRKEAFWHLCRAFSALISFLGQCQQQRGRTSEVSKEQDPEVLPSADADLMDGDYLRGSLISHWFKIEQFATGER